MQRDRLTGRDAAFAKVLLVAQLLPGAHQLLRAPRYAATQLYNRLQLLNGRVEGRLELERCEAPLAHVRADRHVSVRHAARDDSKVAAAMASRVRKGAKRGGQRPYGRTAALHRLPQRCPTCDIADDARLEEGLLRKHPRVGMRTHRSEEVGRDRLHAAGRHERLARNVCKWVRPVDLK